ncbi:MAG: hypothetical protein P4L43_12810 [Syntrophobacteraceae bacterium]|nr:hypothetical protein [Syntrophobacteraceae bacterium]
MNTKKMMVLAAMALAFLIIAPAAPAQAQCYGCNPLLLPFAVVGAAVGTAAAIAGAPFCPYCAPAYGPPPPAPVYYYRPAREYYPRFWVPGHYTPYGRWAPGHWSYR